MARPKKESTEVAVQGSTALVGWEQQLAALAADDVKQEESVASGKFIGTRAGVLKYNGSEVAGNKLPAVVVASSIEFAYYENAFDEDNPESPVCFAFGSDEKTLVPHEASAKPQSERCSTCKQNKFGTGVRADGSPSRGKACKNIRRLALLPAADLNPAVLTNAETAFIKVPVMSVANWASYVRMVPMLRKLPVAGVVTNISSVPDTKSQFRLTFEHLQDLPRAALVAVLERVEQIKRDLVAPYTYQETAPAAPAKGAKKPARAAKY